MSTVLVTGAAGFIGQHVMKALTVAGHSPIGLDVRPVDGYGVEVDADIRQPLDSIPGLDAVIHLAAIAAPRECDKDPGRAFDVNVNGTLQVLKMALASGAKKVVFSSTAHVYGVGPKYLPSPETHPLSLGNTYTTTKILGEELCRLYWENHGLPYTTLRLFNAYGPGQRAGYFVPDMIAKAHGGSITLSDGSTTKDWVYIDDVARAFVLALGTPFVGAVNIGSGRQASLH
ncbi:MAG: NAD(P)-dependent oxidoreductase, partial [Dehalococcoidia bacterium]|nr:NAD(P)-dependent oxidoreductase [Dehalococcoidia bacterium]